jgi:hypothetical protein
VARDSEGRDPDRWRLCCLGTRCNRLARPERVKSYARGTATDVWDVESKLRGAQTPERRRLKRPAGSPDAIPHPSAIHQVSLPASPKLTNLSLPLSKLLGRFATLIFNRHPTGPDISRRFNHRDNFASEHPPLKALPESRKSSCHVQHV